MADVPVSVAGLRAAAFRFRQDAAWVLHPGTMKALLASADELVALADAMEKLNAETSDREPGSTIMYRGACGHLGAANSDTDVWVH